MTNQRTSSMDHPLVVASLAFAVDSHRNHALSPDPKLGGQRRKYSGAHYEVHPIQVAKMVDRSIHGDPVTVAVALLHDVVEDTHRTLGDIREFLGKAFGDDVAADVTAGVAEVTDVSKPEDGNRKTRKELDKLHAWNATPARKTVKLADIKSNMPSIVRHDPGFARKWVQEKADVLPGLKDGDPQLYSDVEKMITTYMANNFQRDEEWDLV